MPPPTRKCHRPPLALVLLGQNLPQACMAGIDLQNERLGEVSIPQQPTDQSLPQNNGSRRQNPGRTATLSESVDASTQPLP